MEQWKRYKQSNIQISNHGNIIGRKVTTLRYCSFSFFHVVYVHRAVYETFIGPIPTGFDINHIDGNRHNNHIDNLEAVSRSDNQLHAFKNGLNKGVPRYKDTNANYKNGIYLNLTKEQYRKAWTRAKHRGLDWASMSVDDRIALSQTPRQHKSYRPKK